MATSNQEIERATIAPEPAVAAQEVASLPRRALFLIVFVLGLSYMFNGLDRSAFPSLLAPIEREFGLTLPQAGFLSNVFTLNIAVFGAVAGWFMGRFGRKWTLAGGLILYSVFTFLIPTARNYGELAFFNGMTGAGEALHITAIFSMLGAYFGRRRGAFLGINNAFFGVGTFLGPAVSTRLFALLHSWRLPFYIYGIAGVAAALAVLLVVPREFSEKADSERRDASDKVFNCPQRVVNFNSVLCVVAFFLTGYSFLAYMALYSLFLRDSLGFTVVAAGSAFSMYGIGALMGFFGGWISDRLRRYGLAICLVIMAADGYVMFNQVHAHIGQMALSFLFGAMLSGVIYPRFLAVAQRSVQPHAIGTAMSMMLPVFYMAGFIAGPVFGKLVRHIGWAHAGTVSITLTASLAAIITCFLKPSRMRGG